MWLNIFDAIDLGVLGSLKFKTVIFTSVRTEKSCEVKACVCFFFFPSLLSALSFSSAAFFFQIIKAASESSVLRKVTFSKLPCAI